MRNHHANPGHPLAEAPAAPDPRLSVYVLATTDAGTNAALQAAGTFARDLSTRVVLLVPHVVPYAQTLEHPADPAACAGERYREGAAEMGLDVTIRVCVCRSEEAVAALLPRNAVVLIGGHSRRWWPRWRTREQALAQRIEAGDRRVLFVAADRAAKD